MDPKKIGDRLVRLRGEKKQGTVASELGISDSALSMYECGERIPRDTIKVKIAKYYSRTVDEIFFAD